MCRTTHPRAASCYEGRPAAFDVIASLTPLLGAWPRVSCTVRLASLIFMNQKVSHLALTNTTTQDRQAVGCQRVVGATTWPKLITFVSGYERIAGVMRKQNYQVAACCRTSTSTRRTSW